MHRIGILALFVAACATSRNGAEATKNQANYTTHPEYNDFRPVAIAVMAVKAPAFSMQTNLRRDLYEGLFARHYSPFKLAVVDSHTDSNGKFDGGELAWDATLEVTVTRFVPSKGASMYDCDAQAVLRYRNGEELWSCRIKDYEIPVPFVRGEPDDAPGCLEIAKVLLDRLPPRPPIAKE